MAQTENLQPNLVDLDDTQQIGQIDASRSEHGISNRTILWALIAAIALALAALGVGLIALTSIPDAVAGPQGPTGLQGATGAEGIQAVGHFVPVCWASRGAREVASRISCSAADDLR